MRRQAGFTLLELLVGLVVLGFILAGLTQGVRYGRRMWADADPGNSHDPPTLQGGPARVAFVSALPAGVTGLLGQEADLGLGVDGAHRLVLRWTPHLHAQRTGALPPPQEAELLRGVDHLDVSYWRNGWQGEWSEPTLPALIRLRIVFGPDDPRHWPDIVVAPVRQRIG